MLPPLGVAKGDGEVLDTRQLVRHQFLAVSVTPGCAATIL